LGQKKQDGVDVAETTFASQIYQTGVILNELPLFFYFFSLKDAKFRKIIWSE